MVPRDPWASTRPRYEPDWLSGELDLDDLEQQANRAAMDESWRQEAASPDEVRALIAQLRHAQAQVRAVEDLAEGWVGVEPSHHYGEAIHHALSTDGRR